MRVCTCTHHIKGLYRNCYTSTSVRIFLEADPYSSLVRRGHPSSNANLISLLRCHKSSFFSVRFARHITDWGSWQQPMKRCYRNKCTIIVRALLSSVISIQFQYVHFYGALGTPYHRGLCTHHMKSTLQESGVHNVLWFKYLRGPSLFTWTEKIPSCL